MVQNHISQLLALVAMEVPAAYAADAIRYEKLKLLGSIAPIQPEDVVIGQYAAGTINGHAARDCREERGVSPTSRTETFVALRLGIDNWRWHGVPFYLRTGKRLPRRVSQIAVTFRRPPACLFKTLGACDMEANVLIPTRNVHRVPVELVRHANAAAYEATLRAHFGAAGAVFDLVLLGVGKDGHTASLFPGHPILQERERWVAAVKTDDVAPSWRITLTPPVPNRARAVFFVVTGADKSAVVPAILGDPAAARRYPAARVHGRDRTVWFADHAALGRAP
jgi:hypothetical protein